MDFDSYWLKNSEPWYCVLSDLLLFIVYKGFTYWFVIKKRYLSGNLDPSYELYRCCSTKYIWLKLTMSSLASLNIFIYETIRRAQKCKSTAHFIHSFDYSVFHFVQVHKKIQSIVYTRRNLSRSALHSKTILLNFSPARLLLERDSLQLP